MNKFLSRKFLLCLAAFLASVGTAITGMCTDNQIIAVVGVICTAVSAGIYAAVEAWVDGKAVHVNVPDDDELTEDEVQAQII